MQRTVFFSVGEPSGDQHAAGLITRLRQLDPDIGTRGFGGPAMQEAGCAVDLNLTDHAVVGLVEVLPKLRQFFRFADQAEDLFRAGDVDAVMLVDFPGFNWHIAKRAKKYGIPVYYYCPPQLWAWAPWRIRKLRRDVDHVLSVLPFEHQYFQARGIHSTFVGHPFFDSVAEKNLHQPTLSALEQQIDAGTDLVAVLPGSRTHEVQRNWPLMLSAISRLNRDYPNARFAVAAYRDRHCQWCQDQLSAEDRQLPIDFYVGKTSEIIEMSRCSMMVSGSVSLELMARRTPAAVIYRVGRLLHTIGRIMIQVDSLTLPNLMAGRKIFPEFVSVGSPHPAVDFLVQSVGAMLRDSFYYQTLLRDLDELRDQYASPGADHRAASWLARTLGNDLSGATLLQDLQNGRQSGDDADGEGPYRKAA